MKLAEQSVGLSLEQKRELVARLLRDRADPERDRPGLVHRRIEIQAGRTPDAIAVAGVGGPLTYAELNDRANRLAHRLRDLGVGPEVLVGLCAGRSASMVVGLLAVLKAGGAYVPIDPSYPVDRLEFLLGDARPGVLLTDHDLRGDLPDCDARVVRLDGDWPAIENDANVDGGASEVNLAYVIYTSGSTGRPKGVQVSHGALDNLLQSMPGLLSIGERDTLLAVTTLSFEIAALELLLPLIVGGQVELIDREVAADASRLAARLDESRATFLQATPATWRSLLEAGWSGKPTLTMLCGGEALPRALADRLSDEGAVLWNLYGPTETTVWSSAWRVEPGPGPISIGRPIAKTSFHVLDKRLRAVPVGVTGELCIGGAGLARGYRDRPDLTAERFIPDPYGTEPGGRLYRTGDLARWRHDGTLECLGRIDHQVKIRGFRVELGEVEAALGRHPEVRDVVVVARPDSSEEMSLAAYIVPRIATNPPTASELRRWLRCQLPEYMIPSTFATLDVLPMTPNGKVDRLALADTGRSNLSPGADFVSPRGPIEQAIAEIWAELLGGGPAGVHDNFFERGGHSLLAVQLLARLRHAFDVEASLKGFLEEPTVSRLARVVEDAMANGAASQAPTIARLSCEAPRPASFAQQRLWFLDQLEPGRAAYHLPAAAKLVGDLDTMALERAINEVVRRHETLRTTLVSVDGVPHQVVADRLELSMAVENLSSLPADERKAHALCRIREEAERPFDMARGPLIRAGLLRLGEREHIATVTMHHAISDGWSIGILIREVSALYEAFRLGGPSPLPELPVQYVDYAVWQRDWLQGPALEAQLGYWRNQLASLPDLELPTDRPRLAVAGHRGGERSAIVPKGTLDAVRTLGRREGATLYVTLLAAFQVLLHRHSGQVDIAVGSPIAGRARTELEGLIGLFVNTLVMRGDLSGNPGFRELLRRVRRTAMDAYAHQDVPFDRLVTLVHPDRNASRTPVFQVMFALQNAPMPALRTPGLLLTPIELPSRTAKFDLTLFAWEVSEGLRLTMEYRTDLFDAATVDRMLAHYQILLGEIIAHPDRPIGALSLLTPDERNQLLVGWNDAAIDDFALTFDEPDDDAHSSLYEISSLEVATHE